MNAIVSRAFMLKKIAAFQKGEQVTLETPVAFLETEADAQACADAMKQGLAHYFPTPAPGVPAWTVGRWIGNKLLVLHHCGACH